MPESPFILFGQQHLITLALSALIIIYFPLYAQNHLSKDHQETTAKILALFLIIFFGTCGILLAGVDLRAENGKT